MPSDLNQKLASSDGNEIKDVLRFFNGDHPAQSLERGCQQGRSFPCGSCGVRADMISDIAHSQTCQWRSLSEQQQNNSACWEAWIQARAEKKISSKLNCKQEAYLLKA